MIEDIFPIFDVTVTLHVPKNIKRAYLPLTGEELAIMQTADGPSITVQKLLCHETVIFEYDA